MSAPTSGKTNTAVMTQRNLSLESEANPIRHNTVSDVEHFSNTGHSFGRMPL